MNLKSLAGIFCILFGSFAVTFAQSTASAYILAEVIAPVGIENSINLESAEYQLDFPGQTVILIEVSGIVDQNVQPDETLNGIKASIKITGDPLTIIDISLSDQSPEVSDETYSQSPETGIPKISIPALALQENRGIVRLGAALHLQEGMQENEHPLLITLNCN